MFAAFVGCALSACGLSLGNDDVGTNPAVLKPPPRRPQEQPSEGGTDLSPEPSPGEDEEDAGGATPDAQADTNRGPLRAFVTSKQANGNMGGVAGADKHCNDVAQAAGLSGTYRAWISTANAPAIDRMTAAGPWVLVNGTTIAATKADLASGKVLANLDKDEKGATAPMSDNRVWTGTGPDGKHKVPDCSGWTATAGDGRTGESEFADARWTDVAVDACNLLKRVYCFAQ